MTAMLVDWVGCRTGPDVLVVRLAGGAVMATDGAGGKGSGGSVDLRFPPSENVHRLKHLCLYSS